MTHRRRLTTVLTAIAAGVAASLAVASPAHANTISSYTTYNRPSSVDFGGEEWVAFADQTSAGYVNVTEIDPASGGEVNHWKYWGTATAPGTGPTISAVAGQAPVVAWSDGNDHINVAYITTNGFACITDIRNLVVDTVNSTPAQTPDTPYITSEGDDGNGALMLVWADTNLHMHLTWIQAPAVSTCNQPGAGFYVDQGSTNSLGSDTTWDGPSWTVSGWTKTSQSNEYFWLTWAGTDSGHHINVAKYGIQAGAYGEEPKFLSKTTESTHATYTDMGGAYTTFSGGVWISYCGTNNVVYYQVWPASNSSGGGSESTLPGSCDVFLSGGYYSGGVGVAYDPPNERMVVMWADKTTYAIQRYVT